MNTIDSDPPSTGSPERVKGLTGPPEQVAPAASTRPSVEAFRCWVMACGSRAAQEPDDTIALCGAKDLPEMIQVIHEAEQACWAGLMDFNQQARQQHCQGDVHEGQRRLRMMVRAEGAAWWGCRLRWLQDVRAYLERERNRCAGASTR